MPVLQHSCRRMQKAILLSQRLQESKTGMVFFFCCQQLVHSLVLSVAFNDDVINGNSLSDIPLDFLTFRPGVCRRGFQLQYREPLLEHAGRSNSTCEPGYISASRVLKRINNELRKDKKKKKLHNICVWATFIVMYNFQCRCNMANNADPKGFSGSTGWSHATA